MRRIFLALSNVSADLLEKYAYKTGAIMFFAAPGAASKQAAEVKIYSIIGRKRNGYDTNSYISGQEFVTALEAAAAGEDAEITVSVNSPGGSVTDGYAMISAMQKCVKQVKAVIDGFAASMGYYACLGANRIEAASNSIIMLHSVQGSAAGSPDDLMAEAEILKKFNATVATLLAARTGLTEAEVTEKYLGKEVYFTAAEALELKLIDAIADYSAQSVPDVKAGMSHDEATQRFTALHSATNEQNLLEKFIAKAKEIFSPKPAKTAMLTDVEENNLCSVLWDVRMAADDADNALKYVASPEAKAILEKVLSQCSALTVEITNAIYGTEVPAAELDTVTAQYVAKAGATREATATTTAIEAARTFVTAELQSNREALVNANAEIERLAAENTTLKANPAAPASRVGAKKEKPAGGPVALEDTDPEFLTEYDRERIARKKAEQEQE